jgi:hypothetical protein
MMSVLGWQLWHRILGMWRLRRLVLVLVLVLLVLVLLVQGVGGTRWWTLKLLRLLLVVWVLVVWVLVVWVLVRWWSLHRCGAWWMRGL